MENLYSLKQDFLTAWSYGKVKEMNLEDYTNLEKENSFCYWLENKTTELGGIGGGSSYKFGIYKRNDTTKAVDSGRLTDGEYAWFGKYGDTKEIAFGTIKNIIIEIIDAVKNNNLQNLDKLDLGAAYKWKIAFLYSDYSIVNIFKYEALKLLAANRGFDFKKKSSISEIQKFLMNLKPTDQDYFSYTHSLWKEYNDGVQNKKPTYTKQKELFINWLVVNTLSLEISNELEALSEEVLARGYFNKFIYECTEYYDAYQLAFQQPIIDNWDIYQYYYNFVLKQIKDKTGIDLSLNYALVTVKNTQEFDYFIDNNIWSGHDKLVYESYVNKFVKGSLIALYKWESTKIKIGAIGVVINNPKTGFELNVQWHKDFNAFTVNLNSSPNTLDFFEIEPFKGNDKIEDIKNIFYKIKLKQNSMKQPLNQILFGAPGTSKTYQTKKIAVEIIDDVDYSKTDRTTILNRYDELYSVGQINFTTFHQSISYEDFIEGIKPVLNNLTEEDVKDNESINGIIEYEVKDGIFKKLCNTARGVSGNINSNQLIDFQNKNFYKMSLGGKHRLDRHNWSIENDLIFLGWGGENDFTHLKNIKDWKVFREKFKKEFPLLVADSKYVIQAVYIFQNMRIGDIVIISKGNKIIDAIGIVESDYFYDDNKDMELFQFRKVKWLASNMAASPELFVSKGISQQTIYQFYDKDIKIQTFVEYFNKPADNKDYKKYVLIIDEINRGNVSSVFGELITLIEAEKRKGVKEVNPEVIEVELPYSNEKFTVPDNLYIIGTMNTADRSVESLDTALRRRFSFIEMQPNPSLLLTEHSNKGIISNDGEDINLITLLKTMNERIELLLDKDHQIGHSFFIKAKTFYDLKEIFKDCIIPLLEEYFFGDFGKIGLVLGGGFIKAKDAKTNFAKNFKYGDDGDISSFTEKTIYEFISSEVWDTATFTLVYE